jgi:hypothetical protein
MVLGPYHSGLQPYYYSPLLSYCILDYSRRTARASEGHRRAADHGELDDALIHSATEPPPSGSPRRGWPRPTCCWSACACVRGVRARGC